MFDQALAHLFTIAWGIWSNRNEIRTGGPHKSALVIASWTKDYLEEFQLANHKVQAKKPEIEVGWSLPHPPWFKINIDGAVFEKQRSMGIEVVIRDHLRLVHAALSMKIHALLGPLETEAKAMEEGIRFTWDRGISAAIFEGDSMVVYHSLTGSATPPSSIFIMISGSLLQATRFSECMFSVVPRNGNKVAHGLAQHAKDLARSCPWIGEIPCFI